MQASYDSSAATAVFAAQVLAFASTEVWIRVRTRRSTPSAEDRGSRVAIALAIYVGVASTVLVGARGIGGALPAPWACLAAGLLLTGGGVALRIWSVIALGRSFTTQVRVSPGQSVVSTGPYRWVRHPSYTALLLVVTGLGLSQTNWLSVLLAAGLPLAALVWRIRIEERALVTGLGAAYEEYAAGRRRLVPGIW